MRNIESLIVSPHPDDAALSLSATIDSLSKKTLITTFDFSKNGIGGDVDTLVRQNEDRRFAKTVDANVIFLNEPDSNYRGEKWYNFDFTLRVFDLDRITSKYLNVIESFARPFNLFIPMAFGLHPDHVMSFYCCLCVFSKIQLTEIDIYFYHDLPYFLQEDAKLASQKTIINATTLVQIQTVR
jgi:LmbE family N-acetylglucosaminyl deacetylase